LPHILDAFLADTVDTTTRRLYGRVVHLRFCGVLCIARSFRDSLGSYAQLTRCFSAVAELLVKNFSSASDATLHY